MLQNIQDSSDFRFNTHGEQHCTAPVILFAYCSVQQRPYQRDSVSSESTHLSYCVCDFTHWSWISNLLWASQSGSWLPSVLVHHLTTESRKAASIERGDDVQGGWMDQIFDWGRLKENMHRYFVRLKSPGEMHSQRWKRWDWECSECRGLVKGTVLQKLYKK